jgi:hypothetical protein
MSAGSRNRRTAGIPRALRISLAVVLPLVLCTGCARRVPLSELDSANADVWTQVKTANGEQITARLVSLDAMSMVVELEYPIRGDVRLQDRLGETELYSGTTRVEGEVVEVRRGEGGRTAVVHMTFATSDVASATFHETKSQKSLRAIISTLLGPVVGGLAGLLL